MMISPLGVVVRPSAGLVVASYATALKARVPAMAAISVRGSARFIVCLRLGQDIGYGE